MNEACEVVHLSEHVGRYLQFRGGQPSMQLLDMVDGELKLELRRALSAAFRKGGSVVASPVREVVGGQAVTLRVTVRSLVGDGGHQHALVVFDESPSDPVLASGAAGEPTGPSLGDQENERLRAQLKMATEDYELTVQRFQATNEELQSINEEQHATGEELETSKEEIESVNEELRTLNQEYRSKIEEMEELNADLKNLIDSTDVATIFLDRALMIRRFTPTVVDLFNFREIDVGRQIGHMTNRLAYPELVDDARSVLATHERVECVVAAEGGRWITVRLAPYRSLDDRTDGVVLTLIDVTERRRLELDQERLLTEVLAANALKSSFLRVLSHDFRTPLNGLLAYTELLADESEGPMNSRQLADVERIRLVAEQLRSMVDELLVHARAESGGTQVSLGVVSPSTVAEEAAGIVRARADQKGLELRLDLPGDLPSIRTDASKLRQILINLLTNAIQFTKAGAVTVRARGAGTRVVFEVEDTGIGIVPEQIERVFDRFWQADPEAVEEHRGTGLGLAVARRYARLLGGGLDVESVLGRGSVFRLWLPAGDGGSVRPRG